MLPSPVSKAYGVFSNRVLPAGSWRRPRAMAKAYIVWEYLSLLDSIAHQLEKGFSMPGTGGFVR